MPPTAPAPARYWALYAQATKVVDSGEPTERVKRRQLIVIPPLFGADKQNPAAQFRYWTRVQRNAAERTRWSGPYGRDLEFVKNTATEHLDYWERQGYGDVMLVTVPLSEDEVRDLRFRGKKTEYRVIDQARKVIRKKYKKEVR